MTRTIQLVGTVDADHRLTALVPDDVPADEVKLAIVVDESHAETEDISSLDWAAAISREWKDDLADSAQDIYSLEDGEPINETHEVYLATFPFGDAPGMKLRPVLTLTGPIGPGSELKHGAANAQIGEREFVLIARADFDKLAAKARHWTEDEYWSQVALKALAGARAKGEKPIPLE